MRPSVLLSAAILLPLTLSLPVAAPTQAPQTAEALTAEYNSAMAARDWPRGVTAAQQLVSLSASSTNLRFLAGAQLNSGAFEESLASYDRAVSAAEKEKPAEGAATADWKDGLAKTYAGKGNALLKLKRTPEAIETYSRSAELAANPGQAWFNVCAVLYNAGNVQDASAACRKSLQADPTKADAWFILGSALYVNSTSDAKGNFIISADTRQALQKYLELEPKGPHADDVKAMLDMAAK